jgi:hypothetical protein
MDDAIRKALEVAKKAALRHEIERRIKSGDRLWRNTTPEEMEEDLAACWDNYQRGHAWQEYVDGAAAAIAAFLEALPPGWHMDKPRDEIAAAVRRAAGGG